MLAEAVNSAALYTALNDTNDNTKLIRIEMRKLKKVQYLDVWEPSASDGLHYVQFLRFYWHIEILNRKTGY